MASHVLDCMQGDKYEYRSTRRQVETTERLSQSKMGKLTDNDLDLINGKREQLVGKLQERYGIARDEAEKQVNEWIPMASSEPTDIQQPSRRKAG